MTKNNFIYVVSVVFLILGAIHIFRLLYGWQVSIGGVMIPMWIYWVEAFLALYLSFAGFRLAKKS